jgi:outer membrane lipoprotein-sorting protein
MRKLLGVWCVAGLLAGGTVRGQEADVKAVLDKAITAHGGADHLAKDKAVTMQMKGKLHSLGDGIDFTGEIASQLPDRLRFEMAITVMGTDLKIKQVVKGDKGWVAVNDMVMELTKEQMAEAREQMHVAAVTRLVALRDKAYKLSPLGEAKVEGKDAVGVRVEHKDRRDVSLYFDKKTGLLLKSETRGKDPMAGDNEFTAETLYDHYRKVDGFPVAHKVTIKRDGKLFIESTNSDVKVAEKLDDSTFEKPS